MCPAIPVSEASPNDGQRAEAHGGPLVVPPSAPLDLPSALRTAIERSPSAAITHLGHDLAPRRQSYAALADEATEILAGLLKAGAHPGDLVLTQLASAADYFPALWAGLLVGMVPVPLSVPASYEEPGAATERVRAVWQMLERPIVLARGESRDDIVKLLGPELPPNVVMVVEELREARAEISWHEPRPADTALMLG